MAVVVFNSLFLIVYLLSAVVQYNDPDPWSWIAIYLAAAIMCISWFCRRLPAWYPVSLLVVSLLWISILVPAVVGKVSRAEFFESISMKTKSVEEAREIGGLALVALWSIALTRIKR